MTKLPTESRNIIGLEGPEYPRYRVGPLCANPLCSRPVDHVHHITRRSFLNGDYAWTKMPDGSIVGNLTGLDFHCHLAVTDNEAQIVWAEESKQFYWLVEGEIIAPLSPQPPLHGAPPATVRSHGGPSPAGPASRERCGSCGRPLPHEHDEKKEPARRRKSFVILCPDDTEEDGALVLSTLLDCCRDLFGHDKNTHTRFFTLAQALSLVVQHGHLMLSEEESSAKEEPAISANL